MLMFLNRRRRAGDLVRRTVLWILILGGLSGVSAMPQQEVPGAGTAAAETAKAVTDMRGREVRLPEEIRRIIALDAGALRLVSYLDGAGRIAAVEDAGHGREKSVHDFFYLATYRLAFPELRELLSIGGAENHEGIIAAEPDLIICSSVDPVKLDQLQEVLGVPVFGVDIDVELYDTERFYRQLETLGLVLGREARAEELIRGIEAALGDLKSRSSRVREAKRAYAGGMMYFGPADLLRTTGDFLPFDLAGAENVMPSNPAGNLQPYMTSLEDLIAASPDYAFIDAANIRLSQSGFAANRKVLEEQVPAFRNRQIYSTLVYKYYGTNWENQLINVYFTGKVLYPDLYGDVSVKEKAREIWRLFFGVDLDFDAVVAAQKGGPGRVRWFD